MKIKRRDLLTAGVSIGVGMAATGVMAQDGPAARGARRGSASVNSNTQPSSVDLNYKPRRINKAIELWEDGQPIYYDSSGLGPGVDPYAQGVKMARTYMDAINVEMEHGALDFCRLREFMRGLVDGGPTRSGHRTPAVFVETCIIGLDEAYMRRQHLGDRAAAGLRHPRHPHVPCPRHQGGAGRDPDGLPLSLRPAGHCPSCRCGACAARRAGYAAADLGRDAEQVPSMSPICGRSIPRAR